MPAPKTNLIPFSCFGYFDSEFAECLSCRLGEPCKNATDSPDFEEVRKIFKYKKSQIKELKNHWQNKKVDQ